MKQVGHADASMYFYVDKAQNAANAVGASVVKEEPYYAHTDKKGLAFMTKTSMRFSDLLMMVKMVHLRPN